MAEIEREVMDVDVLIVGGGCAGLSAAHHLMTKIEEHNQAVDEGKKSGAKIPEQMVVVIEKGGEVGAHSFSGAVMNPIALSELVPEFKAQGCPVESEVTEDAVYYLTRSGSLKFPITPEPFRNHGNLVISMSKLNRWLGERVEGKGVNIFPGFAGVAPLIDGRTLAGVRTGDRGLNKEGEPKGNFEAGLLLKSKLTIFAEGSRGSLFKQVAKEFDLFAGKNPEVFEHGVKEVIQMPTGTVKPGQVFHTAGFPLSKSVGGGFLYTGEKDQIILGIVAYLDTEDPLFDPHRELQRMKTHPFIAEKIKGGKVIAYGGKTLPAGGWYSMPKLYGSGFLVCGDSASMVDVRKLKGIHLAMKSGMLAAETAFEAICEQNFSEGKLKVYQEKVESSYIKEDLYRSRNFHQALSKGFWASLPLLGLQEITGGRGLSDHMKIEHRDAEATCAVLDVWGVQGLDHEENQLPKTDGTLFFDKLSSVYLTGATHDEDSPNHLLIADKNICHEKCTSEYQNPCNHFCPAQVYEMVAAEASQEKRIFVNYTNCIHCKACDIKCPFENISWAPPEGGGGPRYSMT